MLLTKIPALDALLEAHAAALGGDYTAYRNHTYRVVNICMALSPGDEARLEKVATAAAFHDLGIWTDATFDYLEPSAREARAHLARSGRSEWAPEIADMILEHHRVSRARRDPDSLVEAFRRADWVDVSRGLFTFSLPRPLLRAIFAAWPNEGFHRKLFQLALARLATHPLAPLPMLRL